MEISDLIKSARIEKGLTQQQLADAVFVTRQTISKWELGKSVPDQASLILLYQYLDIKDNEKKQLSKLIFNKQNIILIELSRCATACQGCGIAAFLFNKKAVTRFSQ